MQNLFTAVNFQSKSTVCILRFRKILANLKSRNQKPAVSFERFLKNSLFQFAMSQKVKKTFFAIASPKVCTWSLYIQFNFCVYTRDPNKDFYQNLLRSPKTQKEPFLDCFSFQLLAQRQNNVFYHDYVQVCTQVECFLDTLRCLKLGSLLQTLHSINQNGFRVSSKQNY